LKQKSPAGPEGAPGARRLTAATCERLKSRLGSIPQPHVPADSLAVPEPASLARLASPDRCREGLLRCRRSHPRRTLGNLAHSSDEIRVHTSLTTLCASWSRFPKDKPGGSLSIARIPWARTNDRAAQKPPPSSSYTRPSQPPRLNDPDQRAAIESGSAPQRLERAGVVLLAGAVIRPPPRGCTRLGRR
jgi:hypothetical protein